MKKNPGASELRKLINSDYEGLNAQLLSYAKMLTTHYLIWSKNEELPFGKKPIDLVKTVYEKVLAPEGEGRNWNQTETPVFVDFLKASIKSELYNLRVKKENQVKQKIPTYVEEASSDYFDSLSSNSSTDGDLIFNELESTVDKVFLQLKSGISIATTIEDNTGLGRRTVKNALVQIQEIVDSVNKS